MSEVVRRTPGTTNCMRNNADYYHWLSRVRVVVRNGPVYKTTDVKNRHLYNQAQDLTESLYAFVDKRAISVPFITDTFLHYSFFFMSKKIESAFKCAFSGSYLSGSHQNLSFLCQVAGEQHSRHNSIRCNIQTKRTAD